MTKGREEATPKKAGCAETWFRRKRDCGCRREGVVVSDKGRESNGLMKKRSCSAQGLELQGASLVCAACTLLSCSGCSVLYPSSQSSAEAVAVFGSWPNSVEF